MSLSVGWAKSLVYQLMDKLAKMKKVKCIRTKTVSWGQRKTRTEKWSSFPSLSTLRKVLPNLITITAIMLMTIVVLAITLDLFPLLDFEQLEENCSSLHRAGIGNMVKNNERVRKGTWEELCRLPMSWSPRQSFRNMTHRMTTYWNVSIYATVPCSLCTPAKGREWVPHPLLSSRSVVLPHSEVCGLCLHL